VSAAPQEVPTPRGPARVHLHDVPDPRGLLVLGHGAGGSVQAPDLQAAMRAARAAGLRVALVEQPYRVAGRRSTPRPPVLDEAWMAVLAALERPSGPLVLGGRSSGARVACRTAAGAGAAAVLCLAFPLVAPNGTSRAEELDGAGVPVLVVQGARDRFGVPDPDPGRGREVVVLRGDHGLKAEHDRLEAAVTAWLAGLQLRDVRPAGELARDDVSP
jgi:predicted alpha/beta-hydrolase family hydrolase